MLNLLKNNLFDYYTRNSTCTGCLMNKYNWSSKKHSEFTKENGVECSMCFFSFLQILKERNNNSYKKLLNYMLENNNIDYTFPCNNDKFSEEIKQIILNSIVVRLDIE